MQKQTPDHPHHAAVHLIKALNCCQSCTDVSQIDLIQLNELQYRKNILAEELKQISIRGESVQILQSEIAQLDQLIAKLQQENDNVEQNALNQVELAVQQRKAFEEDELAVIMSDLEIEIEENRQLKLEMDALAEKIKQLNRINNQLVFSYTNI